jgi:membrane protein
VLLKRNIFRIVCALFYLPVALLSMFEIINLVMTNSQNRYFLVGGVVFGVLLFLIAAYFIKQKKWLIIAENSRPISIILETIIVVLVGVGLFLWQNLVYGWKTAATSLVLTLCIYAIGRLCSGRICGIISFASSIYLVIYLNQAQYLQEQMTLNMFSFLIPYLCFLIWLKALRFGEKTSVFSCVFGALFLGVVFAFAVRINPLVTVLFLGCFLALFFAGQKNPNPSIFSKGSLCAVYFLVFTAGILAVLFFFEKTIVTNITFVKDASLPLDGWRTMVDYILLKYAKPLFYFFAPFSNGVFVLLFFFFSVLAGYYAIRNRFSFIGPVLITFFAAVCYYILCSEHTNIFYCITCFLPILTGYGFSNILLPEEILPETEKNETEMLEPENAETEDLETKNLETATKSEEPKREEKPEPVPEPKEALPHKEAKEKENLILKTLGKMKDEIPEWTMPEEFIEKQMEIEEEPEPEKTEQLQEPEQTRDSVLEEEPETPSDALVENTYLSAQTEEEQLSNLLNRLDMAEPIKRMNESAQEDMADVIERDEEKVELSEALPLKPSKSTLPKYQKPKFDFDIQPVSIPLDDQYSNISEYDEVPTIHDLENQWKDDSKPIIETVATSMEEAPQTFNTLEASDTPEAVDFTVPPEEIEPEQEVHSEEIVRKNGIGKRSYHKITIR